MESDPDESLPMDGEDDRPWVEAELAELQQEGLAKKRVSGIQMAKILKVQRQNGYGSLLDLLSEHFPDILTVQGRREKSDEDRDDREMRHVGEFAEPITVEGIGPRPATEPLATAKQIGYLRDLGVKDDALLSRLGKSQASMLIDKVLAARDEKYNTPAAVWSDTSLPKQKSGCLGLVIAGLLLAGIICAFARHVLASLV